MSRFDARQRLVGVFKPLLKTGPEWVVTDDTADPTNEAKEGFSSCQAIRHRRSHAVDMLRGDRGSPGR